MLVPRGLVFLVTLPFPLRSCFVTATCKEQGLPVGVDIFLQELTLFSFPEQYKLLSDHIEQMAIE